MIDPAPLVSVFLVAALACQTSPRAPETDRTLEARAYLEKLAARSREIRSLSVRFRQEKRLRILRRPRVSEGHIWYAEERLSMVVHREGAVESHLLVEKGEVKILYPQLRRLEVMEVSSSHQTKRAGTAGAIPFLTGSWEEVEKDYEVLVRRRAASGEQGAGGDGDVLELVPRDRSSAVKRIRLVIVDERLREYSQVDSSGDQVRLEILSWELNMPIPPERFALEIPAGTRTVRLGGAGRRG